MGSRSKANLAYIAGFLDGDGSLMLQLKHRKDGKRNWRFMATTCFYQDSRHEKPLEWIRSVLGIGYISRRKDKITELRINGFAQVGNIVKILLPFIKFKREQAKVLYEACKLLSSKPLRSLTPVELKRLVDYMVSIQKENYVAKRKKSEKELLMALGLTP